MTHTSGKFVQTSKSLHFCLDCSSGTLNFLVSCVSGTAETRHITMSKRYGLPERFWSQDTKNVKHHSLVESSRILLPPLHIKLGLMKNFVKAMDCNSTAFLYLRQKFLLLSDAKIREGVHQSRHSLSSSSLWVMSREHGMPSERWLQAS